MNRIAPFGRSAFLLIVACALGLNRPNLNIRAADGAAPAEPSGKTNVLTFEAALAAAMANNPDFRAVAARVEAAAGRADDARLWSNPEVFVATEDVPVGTGTLRESKDTVGVAQIIPFPGKKKLDGKIGTAGLRVSGAELASRRLELCRDVKTAFVRVIAAGRMVAVARDLVQVAESSSATAQKRVEAGAAPDQELLRAEIQLDQARSQFADFERELADAREALTRLLGRSDLQDVTISGGLAETPDQSLLAHVPEQWLAQHPRVIVAQAARHRTELERQRARLEPYPDVTLGVSGGREGPTDSSIVELRVSLPLPIVNQARGRKREARANVAVAEAEVAAVEQALLMEWRVARQRFLTAAAQVATYRDRIVPKASQALRLVQTGFQEGKFGFIDLLDTQRTTAEAQLAYQQRLLELNLAQAELEALAIQRPANH